MPALRKPTLSQLIEEFAELDRLMKLYQPQVDRHGVVTKALLTYGDDHQAVNQVTLDSRHHRVLLSARKNKSRITDKFEVFKRTGKDSYIEASSITLEFVRGIGFHDLIQTDRIGNREIVSVIPLLPQ